MYIQTMQDFRLFLNFFSKRCICFIMSRTCYPSLIFPARNFSEFFLHKNIVEKNQNIFWTFPFIISSNLTQLSGESHSVKNVQIFIKWIKSCINNVYSGMFLVQIVLQCVYFFFKMWLQILIKKYFFKDINITKFLHEFYGQIVYMLIIYSIRWLINQNNVSKCSDYPSQVLNFLKDTL